MRTITVFFQHQADRFAQTANFRGIELMHMSGMALQGLRVAIPTAVVSLINADTIKSWLDSIPGEITTGLRIAGGMITVVGFAMVINMMRSKALMPFFFLGFITAAAISVSQTVKLNGVNTDVMGNLTATLTDQAQLDLVAIGIIGACMGLLYTQLNPIFHESQVAPAAARPANDLDNELE